jgi:iron complex outermembrane receptor protein
MTSPSIPLRSAVTLTLAISGALASGDCWAEAATAPTAELEEVIVTAEKRAENLQDVPIAVIAVSGQQLRDAGVKDIKDLQTLTPGLTVTSDSSEATTVARIRGIGTVGDNPGLESSVGIVIDGVYRPRNGVGFGDLGELEQIEILEGPQGELFGKNNDAGVINITTKRPSNTFSATGEVTGGNFSDREFNASVTGPIADGVAGRLYAGYQRRNGYLSLLTGEGPYRETTTDNRNVFTVRGQLLFTPTNDIDLLIIADLSKRYENCCGAVPRYTGPFEAITNAIATVVNGGAFGSAISLTPTDYTAWGNRPIVQTVRDYGFSGELNWNLGFGKLTSITAWRDNTQGGGNDFDYTGSDLLQSPPISFDTTDFKQLSEELRLAGTTGPLKWLGGFFYAHETLTPKLAANGLLWVGKDFEPYLSLVASVAGGGAPNPFLISGLTGRPFGTTFIPGASGYADDYQQKSDSYAVFTDETWTVVEGLDLTAGLRFTTEKKSARSDYHDSDGGEACSSIFGPALIGTSGNERAFLLGYGCSTVFNYLFANLPDSQSRTEHNVSGTFKVDYHFTPDILSYASWATGYKAGGFNLARVTFPAGTGPNTFRGQSTVFANLVGIVPNLDTSFHSETVQSYEIGLKSTWLDKTVRANLSLFDERYKDFQLNTFTGIQFVVTSLPKVSSKGGDLELAWVTPVTGLSFTSGITYAYTNIDEFGTAGAYFSANRQNNRLSFAPVWSVAAGLMYTQPIVGDLAARLVVDEKYNTSYNTGSDLNPRKLEGGYGLMDARLGFGPQNGAWAIELWSQNLLNKYYYQVAFDAPFQYQQIDLFPGTPRFWGVTARVKF